MPSLTMSKLFLSIPATLSTAKCNYHLLSFPTKPLGVSSATPSFALSSKTSSSFVTLLARTADWAGKELEEKDPLVETKEGAKLFVGNLPYDMDSETLAELFYPAGTVEKSEVTYNRNTDQNRGFGFVTMRTVEEANKAIEMYNLYDYRGRLLTVNKASCQVSQPEKVQQEFAPSYSVYVGNLPWQVDSGCLEELFSKHGKVVDVRVIYDHESGQSRGFGFVTMATKSDQDEVINALDRQNLEGRLIRVNVAEKRPRIGSFLS